jgi:hydrogenase maturation protease
MNRIICIGNRYIAQDAAGPAVYDLLSRQALPVDTELIDGGVAGLNLLGLFEKVGRVVLVDTVSGFGEDNGPVILAPHDIVPLATALYDHAAGLPYLLRILPEVLDGPVPEIVVVGIVEAWDDPVIADAARIVLSLLSDEVGDEQQT